MMYNCFDRVQYILATSIDTTSHIYCYDLDMLEVECTDIKSECHRLWCMCCTTFQYCRIVHVSVCAATTSSATLHVVHSIPHFWVHVPAWYYYESEVETIVVHLILVYSV